MDLFDREQLSERECEAVFARLFPLGLGGADVRVEIAPAGWDQSPLLAVFHPSVEQVHRERVRIRRNLRRLGEGRRTRPDEPEPTLEQVRATWQDSPVERDREVRELIGDCVWDIFSDNHDVVAPDGRLVHLGSFRGSGGFVADLLNREVGDDRYDYIDFYLGTIWVSDRADLTPVYAMIFRRLARHGYDWEYTFPRLYAVRLAEPDDSERDRRGTELDEMLEDGHREALARAQDEPPPRTVEAYRAVYDRDPRGWPPWE
jgi:hypothetical protein